MLRVLSQQTKDPIVNGLMAALTVSGNECVFVHQSKSAFDAMYEFQPDVVLCYAAEYVEILDEAAKSIGTKVVVLKTNILEQNTLGYTPKPAANIAQYSNGTRSSKWQCPLAYVSLLKPTPAVMTFLENFLWTNSRGQYLKIFGEPIPYPSYIGNVSLADITSIMKSSEFMLTYYNDLLLEAWYNGCVCIPYKANPLLYPEEIFGSASTPDQVLEHLRDFPNRETRLSEAKQWILNDNTYFHRASEMLSMLGYKEESEKCCKTLKDLQL
jgi:hypothetical protein